MADHNEDHSVELGASMDYGEHTSTYSLFVNLAKWGAIICVALLAAMAFGFYTPAGFLSATALFLGILALAYFLL